MEFGTGSGKPGDGTKPEDGVPPISEDVPTIPGAIIDGKIVIDGGNITGGGSTGDGGITTGNLPSMAGAGSDSANGTTGESTVSTMLKVGDGAVIVTVECNGNCMAGLADTVAVANAALTPEQIQLINDGKTIEIRIEVTDISENVPPQDKEVIEDTAEANRDELPGLVAGMYMDTAPETVTISTDLFSSYALVYQQTDEADGNTKCGLCHICPTFLGICCFIWLAIIVVVIVILRRKKETEKA